MEAFYALIVPTSLPAQPPGQGPVYPVNPIYNPIWGGAGQPGPFPPGVSVMPPIYNPIWGGAGQPIFPTPPTIMPPIYNPVFPVNPWVPPMPPVWGGGGQPGPFPPEGAHPMPPIAFPPVISGGPGWLPPYPAHPIVLPPESVPPGVTIPPGQSLVVLYVPGVGIKSVLIPTPGPPGNLPPSESHPPIATPNR